MKVKRLGVLILACSTVLTLAWLTYGPIRQAPAQHGGNVRITGKVTDKILKPFNAAGLPGVTSIQYRRLTMSPGAVMKGKMVMTDHIKLCVVEKGSVTITYADGSTHRYRQGDIFVEPLGLTEASLVADAKEGFVELYWSINVKGKH